ncbi:hypothetical protein CCACVL1_18953 [Corchorus capsularis]|uniref:Uncharacterized protein n=1 Tax=Corchorus capsularis TaxID=210143 RepID=A0A1R3HJE4_COCAP|nr:hypothetical protein CCACVL1_18953 [Corchorus capsularis]
MAYQSPPFNILLPSDLATSSLHGSV